MTELKRSIKDIPGVNFLRRLYTASGYFNKKYPQIIKWGLSSNEDTNFTYYITRDNLKYLAHTIALVTNKEYSQIMEYLEEVESDKVLKDTILAAIESSPEKKFADREVRFGRRIGWYAIARAIKPKVVIETGVDKGLGSMVLCAALLKNKEEGFGGRYYGTDINPKAGYILSGAYKSVGEILYGDSIASLSTFSDKIDLFINDSDHSADYEYQEYLTIKPLLTDKSFILGDNSHSNSKLADFSVETGRRFVFFQEKPSDHWYPGAGIGISFKRNLNT